MRPPAERSTWLALMILAAALPACSKPPPVPVRESDAPPPPAAAAPKRTLGPVAEASKAEVTALLTRLATERGMPGAEVAAVVKAWFDGPEGPYPDAVFALGAFEPTYRHKLYRADADNDGRDDWVIVGQNIVSDHRSGIEHVFTDRGGKLVELPFAETVSQALLHGRDLGPNFHMYVDDPLLVVEAEGTALGFSDTYAVNAKGEAVGPTEPRVRVVDKHYRYRWKGAAFTLLAAEDRSVDAK